MAPRYFIVTDVTCVLRHIDDKIGELYISTLNLPKKVLSSKSGEGNRIFLADCLMERMAAHSWEAWELRRVLEATDHPRYAKRLFLEYFFSSMGNKNERESDFFF